MAGYLFRRGIQMIIVVMLSAAATYALLNLAPGGPTAGLRQIQQSSQFQITAEDIARIRAYYELDLYLPVRFSRWLIGQPNGRIIIGSNEYFPNTPIGCYQTIEDTVENDSGDFETVVTGCEQLVYLRDLEDRRSSKGVLRGDFGLSWRLNRDRPVSDLIVGRLPKTLQLMGLALLISFLVGVPIGIYSAVKQYSKFDYAVTSLAFFGSAMPVFFFGLLLILLFSIIPKGLGWPYLPPGSSEAVRNYTIPLLGEINAGSLTDRGLHLILPALVLAMAYVAQWSRFVRASMLDVLRQDYVRTARAKGLDRAGGDRQARLAQRPDPIHHHRGILYRDHVRRCDHHRIDLLLAGDGPSVHPRFGRLRLPGGDGAAVHHRRINRGCHIIAGYPLHGRGPAHPLQLITR